ncbi:Hyccin family-containing protein [Strongyloides ratti]|uniref:Hyccin family-containing protein n=1 Tax=Strongyloides ratti TaxID=34506 RepID=A0A090L6L0_STRRB|nr:Hyccin family-containing protein [Strongyloides ratti]CEF65436.1 Hyccin family-containing protein [Strongyloides ratti]
MNSQQLQSWLEEISNNYKSIEDPTVGIEDYTNFLNQLIPNTQVLIQYLTNHYNDVYLIQPIIAQILMLYYKKGAFRYFTLQLIPSFMIIYFTALSKKQKNKTILFENFFLAIYNEEILANGPGSSDMEKKVEEIRIPSISTPSVYHNPKKLGLINGDNSSLSYETEPECLFTVKIGPYQAIEKFNAETKYLVLNRLLRGINSNLSRLSPEIVGRSICILAILVTQCGFNFPESQLSSRILGNISQLEVIEDFSNRRRIPVNAIFLRELICGVYFSIYNYNADFALKALESIHYRAQYEMLAEILVITEAIIQ